jgi:hypothetical protein
MKKRTFALIPAILSSIIVFLLLSSCGRMSATDAASRDSSSADAASASVRSTPTASPEPTTSAAETSAETESSSAATSESSAVETSSASTEQATTASESAGTDSTEASSGSGYTDDQLAKGMNDADSYRRIIKTTTTSEGAEPFVIIHDFSTVRNPYADHYILEFPGSTSYSEDMLIVDTMYTRMEKDGKWEKYGPGNWQREKPLAYSYSLQATKYVIEYQKLTYKDMGQEDVNGMKSTHYAVSGTYDGEFEAMPDTEKYAASITISGDIWIADVNAVGPVLISQRIELKTDVTIDKDNHVKEELIVEDDTLGINSTVIEPPIK